MNKKKFFIVTTVPMSFVFFKGQLLRLKEEFDITLISSPEKELVETATFNKVKSYGISMNREISLINDFISLVKLISYFVRSKPDIVHGNTPKGSLLSLAAAWFCRVPTRIYYVHGLRYQGTKGSKRKLLMTMEKISCFFATDIIAVSNGVKQVLSDDAITRKPVNIIWNGSINGINLDYFDPQDSELQNVRPIYGIEDSDFVFGFVGRLTGDKGINELVYAFSKISKKYNNTKLLLVGGYENDLDALSIETLHEIETNRNIVAAGVQKDVRSFLNAMNLFVFPSYREGFGIALMEAAAMNVPAISSNIIGCNEIISDRVNGYLISIKDGNELFMKMKYSIENQSEVRNMAKIARLSVAKKFEQKELWDKTMKCYRNISS